jgi:hypothetical protein
MIAAVAIGADFLLAQQFGHVSSEFSATHLFVPSTARG